MKVKVIANYLPQFHRIPENDLWWGEGYTDWMAVKSAKPILEGQYQPKIPLNNNYYDLSDITNIRWQTELAKKYGVYGFAIYHYWFNAQQKLLEKPAEIILKNKDIDIHYMFIWDYVSWKRTWSRIKGNDWSPVYDKKTNQDSPCDEGTCCQGDGVLARLDLGTEKDWKQHFDYLLPFFRDQRYIKIDGKPMIGFMSFVQNYEILLKMTEYWDKLAKSCGYPGIVCMNHENWRGKNLQKTFRYSLEQPYTLFAAIKNKFNKMLYTHLNKIRVYDYDELWQKALKSASSSGSNVYLCGQVNYDDTARRGEKGHLILGASPDKFKRYFKELLEISGQQGKEFLFCVAWNEWAEGMYLEPDTLYGYGYLDALKAALIETNNY